ncbi:sn1-specific diacylglycerol lipase [Klebsormidium nitens]|uniref:Sn1-specific diacylglycerol lipase n=1 Tax=Klebsormidium nitens TaxID=105231 RepID=A0A1Y1HP19_KLENI|nr:sn1-specific diacylglycerol lipase [Klebsormidium nitens]|eukprot:GAQ79783.1 sn1-specific diacylglycerol lipase [Klebsormidium nitens]
MAFILRRAVVLVVGGSGAFILVQKLLRRTKPDSSGQPSPLELVAKGASQLQNNVGAFSLHDTLLALTAMSKVSEEETPAVPGKPAPEAKDALWLLQAQHWRVMAEAVYAPSPAQWSIQTAMPESNLLCCNLESNSDAMRPAFVVAIDGPFNAVVLAVRGTADMTDMLLNAAAEPVDFKAGRAHAGLVHASKGVLEEARDCVDKAMKDHKGKKLVCVGHSLGAATAILAGHVLREDYPNVECWGFSTPACLTLDAARSCAEYATSVLNNHDVVPRFMMANLERLRQEISDFDFDHAREIMRSNEDLRQINTAAEAMKRVEQAQHSAEGLLAKLKSILGKLVPFKKRHNHKEERQESNEEKEGPIGLYPPGKLLVLSSDPYGHGLMPESRKGVPSMRDYGVFPSHERAAKTKWTLNKADQTDFERLYISPWVMSDHMMITHMEGLDSLQHECEPFLDRKRPAMSAQSSQTDPEARKILKDASIHPLAWVFMGAFVSAWLRI